MIKTIRLTILAAAAILLIASSATAQTTEEPKPGVPSVDSLPGVSAEVADSIQRSFNSPSRPKAKQYNQAIAREWQALDYVTFAYAALMTDEEFLRILPTGGRRSILSVPYNARVQARSDDRRSNLPKLDAATLAQSFTMDSTLESIVDWYTRQYGFEFVIHRTLLDGEYAGDTLTVARAVRRIQNTMVSVMIWNPTVTAKGKGKKRVESLVEKTSVSVQERAYRSREEMIVEGPDAVVELTWKIPYRDLIQSVSLKYQIDPYLIAALVQQESNFNAGAMSEDSALGLTQMIPGTADMMGISDPTNPKQSLDGGVRYLKLMLKRFNGNVQFALAAYNAGPGNVDKYRGIPPFQETRDYVKRIMARYEEKVTGRPLDTKSRKRS